jgi:hypothetical protein
MHLCKYFEYNDASTILTHHNILILPDEASTSKISQMAGYTITRQMSET